MRLPGHVIPRAPGPGLAQQECREEGDTCDTCWSKTVSKMKVFSRDRCVRSGSSGSSPGSMSTTIWVRGGRAEDRAWAWLL